MDRIKLHDLRCFDAVATKGSFQAAGAALNRSHPSVFAAVARLEQQLGLTLLDRSGYRVGLTDAGQTFHERTRLTLRELDLLQTYADQLSVAKRLCCVSSSATSVHVRPSCKCSRGSLPDIPTRACIWNMRPLRDRSSA